MLCEVAAIPPTIIPQDGRHQVALTVGVRSIRQDRGPIVARRHFIGPKHVRQLHGMGHGLHVLGVEFGELLDVLDDLAELPRHRVEFDVSQQQPRKQRNLFDLFA